MSRLRTTRDLLDDGYTEEEIRQLVGRGEIDRLRRGSHGFPGPAEADRHRAAVRRHRDLVAATLPVCGEGSVVSHGSAAVLWGLPQDGLPSRVEVTRNTATSGQDRGWLHLRVARMSAAEVTVIDGLPVTTLARTVVDLARSLPLDRSVVPGDAALSRGLDREQLAECLELARGRPGIARARRACGFFDARSESPGESISRVRLVEAGIPAPELQREVFTPDGELIARLDFYWPECRTAGEFDGLAKYDLLAAPGQSPRDVVLAEKNRERAVRRLGIEVVRWGMRDLRPVGGVVTELREAFARGRTR